MNLPKLYGFGFIRNGVKYDYPFKESIQCLQKCTDDVFYCIGDSEDETRDQVLSLNVKNTKDTVWDANLKKGGLILSQQTNETLEFMRSEIADLENAWGFYLQSDEIIHERDYPQLREDIRRAQETGCDAISFRYWHFWIRYDQVAIAKKWYPQEIRAIKLSAKIESWGDAQSFRGTKKIYESDLFIYHYGHVREEKAYEIKKSDILNFYVEGNERRKKRVLRRQEREQECLRYLGPHPALMHERMARMNFVPCPKEKAERVILLKPPALDAKFLQRIWAKDISLKNSYQREKGAPSVYLGERNLWSWLFFPGRVPEKMRSPYSRPWPLEVIATLKLSEAGIWVN